MKKKVMISFAICLIASIVAFVIGMGVTKSEPKLVEIDTPSQISYFSDNEKTEKFTITFPKEHSDKIITTIDEPVKDAVRYTFKHIDSGEILFVITICKNESYTKLNYPYETIKETKLYTYLWSQGNITGATIKDKTISENFKSISQYVPTIKSLFIVEQVVNDEEYMNSIEENNVEIKNN